MRASQPAFISQALKAMLGRVLGPAPAEAIEERDQNLTHKQAKIRAASVRAGFAAMRARNEELSRHLHQLDGNKHAAAASTSYSADAAAPTDSIILSCEEPPPAPWSQRPR